MGVLLAITSSGLANDFQTAQDYYWQGDQAAAIRIFQTLADQGDADAQMRLGMMHANGEGGAVDPEAAFYWLRRAAEQGQVEAQGQVGGFYLRGRGVTSDPVMAYVWLNVAIVQGGDRFGLYQTGRAEARQRMSEEEWDLAQRLALDAIRRYTGETTVSNNPDRLSSLRTATPEETHDSEPSPLASSPLATRPAASVVPPSPPQVPSVIPEPNVPAMAMTEDNDAPQVSPRRSQATNFLPSPAQLPLPSPDQFPIPNFLGRGTPASPLVDEPPLTPELPSPEKIPTTETNILPAVEESGSELPKPAVKITGIESSSIVGNSPQESPSADDLDDANTANNMTLSDEITPPVGAPSLAADSPPSADQEAPGALPALVADVSVDMDENGGGVIRVRWADSGRAVASERPVTVVLLIPDTGVSLDNWYATLRSGEEAVFTLPTLPSGDHGSRLVFWSEGSYLASYALPFNGGDTTFPAVVTQAVTVSGAELVAEGADLSVYLAQGVEQFAVLLHSPHWSEPRLQPWTPAPDLASFLDAYLLRLAETADNEVRRGLVESLGERLYIEYTPPNFRQAFQQLQAELGDVFQSLQIVADDHHLPWEVLRPVDDTGNGEFLGISHRLGRWDSRVRSDRPPSLLTVVEMVDIVPQFQAFDAPRAVVPASLSSRSVPGTLADLGEWLSEDATPSSWLHVAGPAIVRELDDTIRQYAIALEDGELDLIAWRWLTIDSDQQPFVVFNTWGFAQLHHTANFIDDWTQAVLDSGAQGYIGGLWPVSETASRAFNQMLYTSFADSRPAERLRQIRRQFYDNADPSYLAWVFFGDPALRIVVPTATVAGQQVPD